MCRPGFVVSALLAAALAFPGAVAPAFATWPPLIELNDSEEPGSVLVFHHFRTGTVTLVSGPFGTNLVVPRTELEISVTCPKGSLCSTFPATQDVFLRAHWVCPGNPSGASPADFKCVEEDFPLQTTVNGTIYINPEGGPVGILDPLNPLFVNFQKTPPAPCSRGYLIVWVVNQFGQAIKFDGLIGDAIIREDDDTASAYNALPIQAASGLLTNNATDVDLDSALDFDGTEYKAITGKIFGTVRYERFADTLDNLNTRLILLTLDVKSNRPNNPTHVDFNFFNEKEEFISTNEEFVCWDRVRLTQISSALTENFGGKGARKGLVESLAAVKVNVGVGDATTGPVTLIGIVTTRDFTVNSLQEYSYSLYNDSKPVPTTFEPAGINAVNNAGLASAPPPGSSSTITFDDKTPGALDGEYPAGVANWGSGAWIVSGPFAQFTTNSISYSGSGITSASFTFVSPKALTSLQASNGGTVDSVVSVSCSGNPTVSVTVGVNQLVTINTGWTNACSPVTISSSNGWDTNFDNLTYQ